MRTGQIDPSEADREDDKLHPCRPARAGPRTRGQFAFIALRVLVWFSVGSDEGRFDAGCGLFGVAVGDCGLERSDARLWRRSRAGKVGRRVRARRFLWRRRLARRRGAAAAKMRLARPAMSVWKAKAARIAGREVVGWDRSHGLLRFRCKSCGRTFNALTNTPMAHPRRTAQAGSARRRHRGTGQPTPCRA
jgi:hypothetical protein